MEMNNLSGKITRNICFPHSSNLTSAAQIIVNDNTDDYFLLINKTLLDCLWFKDKQHLDILFQMSQSTYFSILSQLLLV
jgi:hypothetical protein